jgi:hypothetical protein
MDGWVGRWMDGWMDGWINQNILTWIKKMNETSN